MKYHRHTTSSSVANVLQHLSDSSVRKVLENFSRSGSRFLLVTSTPVIERKWDLGREGEFRAINLCLPPYSLGTPIREVVDYESSRWEQQKHLVLYRLPLSLPDASSSP